MHVRRQNVDCADDVPVEYATASPALVDAAAGLFPLPTHGACLGCIVLILQHDLDPDTLGFVRDVLAESPMRPARHLLVGSVAQVDTICGQNTAAIREPDPLGGLQLKHMIAVTRQVHVQPAARQFVAFTDVLLLVDHIHQPPGASG